MRKSRYQAVIWLNNVFRGLAKTRLFIFLTNETKTKVDGYEYD